LIVEDRRFDDDSWIVRSWSVVVDVVGIGMIVWIASGLYMWWGVRGDRRWGWLAVAGGIVTFLVFTLGL
jgi:hypothetical protein